MTGVNRRFLHISSRILNLPPAGVDGDADHAILTGKIRDVSDRGLFDENGRPLRVGRTKGVTFEHADRAEHRAGVLAARRGR